MYGRDERIADFVHIRGGVVRQSTLYAGGWTKYMIAGAVASGAIMRVRRSWVTVPDADPLLVIAARAGVVLTCVTQAKRLGLWVLSVDRLHVAAASHVCDAGERTQSADLDPQAGFARVHWGHPLVPRHPDALVDPVENVLSTVAGCQPLEPALAIWESALRQGMVDALALQRLPLSGSARRILEMASPFSDSGLESFVVPRLRWLDVRIVPQAWLHGHRVDFLVGARLVLQIDGSHHVGAQRTSDIVHDANLMLQGYHVIRVGYRQVIDDWPGVQDLIARAIAQGLHRAGRVGARW